MLGHIVVRFMSAILNIIGTLIIIAGTIAGGVIASQGEAPVLLGILLGLVASFLFMVVTCGVAFLALEINNNLIRIKDALQNKP